MSGPGWLRRTRTTGCSWPAVEAAGGAVSVTRAASASERPATFDGRDVFAPAAAALCRGEVGIQPGTARSTRPPRRSAARAGDGDVAPTAARLRAEVTWVDRFGNAQLAATGEGPCRLGGWAVTPTSPPATVRRFAGCGPSRPVRGEAGVLVDANGCLALVVGEGSAAPPTGAGRSVTRWWRPVVSEAHPRYHRRRWARAGDPLFPADPRGHRGPPPRLPADPGRAGAGGDDDGVLGPAGRHGPGQRGQGPQGPVLPRLLRHPGDRATTSPSCSPRSTGSWASTGLAGGRGGHRQPGPGPGQLRGVHLPGLPGGRPLRRRPRAWSASGSGPVTVRHADELPGWRGRTARSSASSPPRPRRPRTWPTPLVATGVRRSSTSPPGCSPCPADVLLRYVDLSIELQVMSFYQSRRDCPGRPARSPPLRSVGLSIDLGAHEGHRPIGAATGVAAPGPACWTDRAGHWAAPGARGVAADPAAVGRRPIGCAATRRRPTRCPSSSLGSSTQQAPLDLLERVAVADDDLAKVWARCATGPTCPSRWSSPPACGPRSTPSSTGSTRASPRSRSSWRTRPASTVEAIEEHASVRFDDAVTVHLFEVAAGLRVGGAGRDRGARPGPPGLGAGRGRAGGRAGALRAVPPRRRRPGKQVRVRDGHRPGHDLAVPRGRGAGRSPRRTGGAGRSRRAGGGGRGDGRGHRRRPGRSGGRDAGRGRGGQPHGGPGRRPGSSGPAWARARAVRLADLPERPGRRRRGGHRASMPRLMWSPRPDVAPVGGAGDRPLLVVDLGVPRNVEPAAGALAG